jgi:hypothetical protein
MAPDKRTGAMQYFDKTHSFQGANRFPHGGLANTELIRQFSFAWQALAVGKSAGHNVLAKRLDYLVDDFHFAAARFARFADISDDGQILSPETLSFVSK